MTKFKLYIKSAKQIVLIRKDAKISILRGKEMQTIETLEGENQNGISILVNREGKIECIGNDSDLERTYKEIEADKVILAYGKCVLPGFVDAHTHPVWVGDRVHEFAMKLAGATYMEVHKAGGGIHYTVEHTRKASEEELLDSLIKRLKNMQKCGTTFVECKSGYGLDAENEIKMLKVIHRARNSVQIGISSTYCGAHAVPKGKSSEEATNDVIQNQIPQIRDLMDKGELQVENIDVFCEEGVFNIDQSRRILQAGKDAELNINFHGDELHPLNGAKMGAELEALTISHLEEISDEGIQAMTKSGSIGVVLPTTAYILRLKPPPVRKMIDAGMAVALGSDFNPNAYCLSMPLVMHLACIIMHMTMTEALIAATLNSAAALGVSDQFGSITEGKYADMVIINASRWEHLIYCLGCHDNIIDYVIKKGDVVYEK